jgi:hypothetical protein
MARRPAVSKTKLKNAAALLGINLETLNIPTPEQSQEAMVRRQIEAESVLAYVATKGAGFKDKVCKECELPFSSTYHAVAYCSENCRASALERVGIPWNPHGKTDLERWGGKVPKTIGPQATKRAKEAVEKMATDED